jgi:hypothetical protein
MLTLLNQFKKGEISFNTYPQEILIPHGEAYVAPKTMLNRHGLLVNENKKAEFSSTESVRLLNRLLRFKKGQQENAAALPEVSLDHSMAALAALVKHLDVTYLHIFLTIYN